MKKLSVIIVILLLFTGMTACQSVMSVEEVTEVMSTIKSAGLIIENEYVNDILRLRFSIPDDKLYQTKKPPLYVFHSDEPNNIYAAGFSTLLVSTTEQNLYAFNFKVRYENIPQFEYKNENSEELTIRTRNDFIELAVNEHKTEFKNTYIVSDIESIIINGNEYFYYSYLNKRSGVLSHYYQIRKDDYAFIYGFKTTSDTNDLIDYILNSINYY